MESPESTSPSTTGPPQQQAPCQQIPPPVYFAQVPCGDVVERVLKDYQHIVQWFALLPYTELHLWNERSFGALIANGSMCYIDNTITLSPALGGTLTLTTLMVKVEEVTVPAAWLIANGRSKEIYIRFLRHLMETKQSTGWRPKQIVGPNDEDLEHACKTVFGNQTQYLLGLYHFVKTNQAWVRQHERIEDPAKLEQDLIRLWCSGTTEDFRENLQQFKSEWEYQLPAFFRKHFTNSWVARYPPPPLNWAHDYYRGGVHPSGYALISGYRVLVKVLGIHKQEHLDSVVRLITELWAHAAGLLEGTHRSELKRLRNRDEIKAGIEKRKRRCLLTNEIWEVWQRADMLASTEICNGTSRTSTGLPSPPPPPSSFGYPGTSSIPSTPLALQHQQQVTPGTVSALSYPSPPGNPSSTFASFPSLSSPVPSSPPLVPFPERYRQQEQQPQQSDGKGHKHTLLQTPTEQPQPKKQKQQHHHEKQQQQQHQQQHQHTILASKRPTRTTTTTSTYKPQPAHGDCACGRPLNKACSLRKCFHCCIKSPDYCSVALHRYKKEQNFPSPEAAGGRDD